MAKLDQHREIWVPRVLKFFSNVFNRKSAKDHWSGDLSSRMTLKLSNPRITGRTFIPLNVRLRGLCESSTNSFVHLETSSVLLLGELNFPTVQFQSLLHFRLSPSGFSSGSAKTTKLLLRPMGLLRCFIESPCLVGSSACCSRVRSCELHFPLQRPCHVSPHPVLTFVLSCKVLFLVYQFLRLSVWLLVCVCAH